MFSDFEIDHPLATLLRDLLRRAKRRSKERDVERLPEQVPLIPGLEALAYLPALPTEGIVSADGKVLGGFPAAKAGAVRGAGVPEWRERMELLNEKCGKVIGRRGKHRAEAPVVREAALQQAHGNIRLDVTFGLRRGAQHGLDVQTPLMEMLVALGPQLEAQFPGVRVGGGVVHPPSPFVSAAEAERGANTRASGLNLHVQEYLYEAFGGHWLTESHRGVSKCREATVASMHLRDLGVDVHAHARMREAVRREWLYSVSTKSDWKRMKQEPRTVRRIMAIQGKVRDGEMTVADAVAEDMAKWDASWAKSKKTVLDQYERDLRSSSKGIGREAINWWLASRATEWLERELPKRDPRWAEILGWGRKAAKAVEEAHIASKFQVPMLSLLEDLEAAEADDQRRREVDGKVEEAVKLAEVEREGRLVAERQAHTLEAEKREDRAVAADVQATLSAAVAVAAPTTLKTLKTMMATGVVPEGAEVLFEVNKSGRIWPAPLYRAMQQVILRGVGTPEQLEAAKEAVTLTEEYVSFLKTKPTLEAMAARRAEWAKAYPVEEPPPAVPTVDEVEVGRRVAEAVEEREARIKELESAPKAPEVPAAFLEPLFAAASSEFARVRKGEFFEPKYLQRDSTAPCGWALHIDVVTHLDGALGEALPEAAKLMATERVARAGAWLKTAASGLARLTKDEPLPTLAQTLFVDGRLLPEYVEAAKLMTAETDTLAARGPGREAVLGRAKLGERVVQLWGIVEDKLAAKEKAQKQMLKRQAMADAKIEAEPESNIVSFRRAVGDDVER